MNIMRKLIFIVIPLVIAGVVLGLTNPGEEAFISYLRKADIIQSDSTDSALEQIKDRVLEEVLVQQAKKTIRRKNYVIFSTFEYSSVLAGKDHKRYLGIASRFVDLGNPSEDSPDSSR